MIQRVPGLDDVLHKQDVRSVQFGSRVVQQLHCSRGNRIVSIRRGHQEVHLVGPPDPPNQIGQKDKASLQQANDQEFPIPVMATDLAGQLRDTPVDGLFIEYHPGRIPFH
jgi:hypothetical protein